jgi:hypothetical protein
MWLVEIKRVEAFSHATGILVPTGALGVICGGDLSVGVSVGDCQPQHALGSFNDFRFFAQNSFRMGLICTIMIYCHVLEVQ